MQRVRLHNVGEVKELDFTRMIKAPILSLTTRAQKRIEQRAVGAEEKDAETIRQGSTAGQRQFQRKKGRAGAEGIL